MSGLEGFLMGAVNRLDLFVVFGLGVFVMWCLMNQGNR